jgi:fatty acid desaturase
MSVKYNDLRKELSSDLFKPYPQRLLTLSFVIVLWMSLFATLVLVPLYWPYKLLLSLVIGQCWGMSGLLAHELLHGSIIRNKAWQNFFGFWALLPFTISPTFWRYWHNNLHHSHTQKIILDPDAYPTYRIFKQSKFAQWMFPITPGSGHKRSYLYFFLWFSVNTNIFQLYFRFRNKTFNKLDQTRVTAELILSYSLFISLMIWAGPANLLWVFVIPFLMQNYMVFSYISTNHNLSPLTKQNDPLENSLTVTNHPWLENLHFNFGYHVEHHLFPTMSPKFIKPVHELLKIRYPDKYQYMPKWQAIKALYSTARIYKDSKTLYNPKNNKTYDVIGKNKFLGSTNTKNSLTCAKELLNQAKKEINIEGILKVEKKNFENNQSPI